MTSSVPQTMKAHLYTSTAGGVEKNLTYSASARTPPPPSKPSQLLIKVLSTSLNPADYKVPEQSTILGKVLVCRTPASPGLDFAGRVVATHPNHNGEFTPGDLVFGCLARPREFGTLGEYILANTNDVAHLPDGVSVDEGACLGVAARTAWQALKYYVPMPSDLASSSSASSSSSSAESAKGEKNNEQKRVFINGSSGGCGIFAVQFAKMLNCHVTVTCSSRNIDLVRDLGADEVIDYTSTNVLEALIEKAEKAGWFDHVIDHIGLPENLYSQSHLFLKEEGYYVQVGSGAISSVVWRTVTPRAFGGGRRRFVPLMLENRKEDLDVVAALVGRKKVRVVVDRVVGFSGSEVVAAYERLRSGRARGKIIVRVMGEE